MKQIYFVVMMLLTQTANAQIHVLSEVPSSWKLENYSGNNVVVWYSGTTCTNGLLQFKNSATIEDKNRFWSTVLSAKVANKVMFVRWDDTDGCKIDSFGMH